MPDLRSTVQKMVAAGESEEDIAAVIKKLSGGSEIKSGLPDMSPAPPDRDEYTGPDTFWGGVKNSLFGKEFDETARKSLTGFAKGAADIPATLADTAHGLAAGTQSLFTDPAAHFRAMPEAFREMGRGIRDVTMNAGADPESFGHLSGQIFGQPAFTEGLIKAPTIAKATTGAINRIPVVNKTLSSVGRTLEGTRSPNIIPTSSGGLIAGAVRGAARPVGRALQRAGERGRLAGSGVETANEAAARTTPNSPPTNKVYAGGGEGAVRPRPVRQSPRTEVDQNTEFTRPIVETAEELAARNRPTSVFTDDNVPADVDPIFREPVDTTPYEPPPIRPEGLPPEPPPIDPFAAPEGKIPLKGGRLKQNRRNQSQPYVPSVDPFAAPTTPPIGVGEGGLSSRYRSRPYEVGQEAAAREGARPSKSPAPVEPPKFEPSVDPATNFSPEDIALMRAKEGGLKTALEKMASGETVDPLTGEIINPRRAKNWRQSEPNAAEAEFGPLEPGEDMFGPNDTSIANDAGRQFASDIERTFPGDEAYDLGEISPNFRQTSSMPDWGPPEVPQRTILPEEWGDWGGLEADIPTLVPDQSGSHVAAPRPGVNPLRPEVPPGQVTNRSMFQLSEQRAAEGLPNPGREFADSIAPNEFSEDMMFTPSELEPSVVPPQEISPFENQFDPRISNLEPASDVLEGASPEFTNKRVTDVADDSTKGRLVPKGGREKNFPSIIPEDFGKVGGRPVGPKGASYTVRDPNGKKLGDINVTPKDIAEVKAMEEFAHADDMEIAEMIYQDRKEDLLVKHGYDLHEPKIQVEPKTTRTKDVQVPAEPKAPKVTKLPAAGEAKMMGAEPTYSEAPPVTIKTEKRTPKPKPVTKTPIPFEPNKAFGAGGDIKPIEQEFARLQRINADDAKYGELLPDDLLTGPLEPGQTYKQKLQEALKTLDELEGSNARRNPEKETADWNERQQVLADLRNKLKIGELDDFANRVIEMSRLDPEPIHAPLDPSKIDISKLRSGKLNQNSGKLWMSPKMQQQQNALYRKRMGLPPKPPKK